MPLAAWIPLLIAALGATPDHPPVGPEGGTFTLQFDVAYAGDVYGGGPWSGVNFAYRCQVIRRDAQGTVLSCALEHANSFSLEQTDGGAVRNLGQSADLAPTLQAQYGADGTLISVTGPPEPRFVLSATSPAMATFDAFLSLALPMSVLEEEGSATAAMPEKWSFIVAGSGQPVSKVRHQLRRRGDEVLVVTRGGMSQMHAASDGQIEPGHTLSTIRATAHIDPATGQLRSRHVEVTFGFQVPRGYELQFEIAPHLSRTIDVQLVNAGPGASD